LGQHFQCNIPCANNDHSASSAGAKHLLKHLRFWRTQNTYPDCSCEQPAAPPAIATVNYSVATNTTNITLTSSCGRGYTTVNVGDKIASGPISLQLADISTRVGDENNHPAIINIEDSTGEVLKQVQINTGSTYQYQSNGKTWSISICQTNAATCSIPNGQSSKSRKPTRQTLQQLALLQAIMSMAAGGTARMQKALIVHPRARKSALPMAELQVETGTTDSSCSAGKAFNDCICVGEEDVNAPSYSLYGTTGYCYFNLYGTTDPSSQPSVDDSEYRLCACNS